MTISSLAMQAKHANLDQFVLLRKYRVGDYRIINHIKNKDAKIEILVLKVGHPREVCR